MNRSTLVHSLIALALVLGTGALIVSCSDNSFDPVGNQPPETGLVFQAAVQDTLSPVFYSVNMKWWGSDPDGEIIGFEYKWTPVTDHETFDFDTSWVYTAFTTKLFNVPVPDSSASYSFAVRAIDNEELRDPTPAMEFYPFVNRPPTGRIRFRELLPDSTWPVIAFGWDAFDPDGDSTLASHEVWVKGQEDRITYLPADVDTILIKPASLDTFGDVTIYFQTVDQGFARGARDSFNVHLYETPGDILLVDGYDLASIGLVNSDGFYKDALNERVGPEGYTYLDLAKRPFDTDVRFEAFLEAFHTVIWYTGVKQRSVQSDQANFSQMTLADSVMGEYLKKGGNLFLSSLNGAGTFAGFSPTFSRQNLGIPSFYRNRTTASTSFEFDPTRGQPCLIADLTAQEPEYVDLSLRCPIQFPGIDSPDTTNPELAAELIYRMPGGVFKGQFLISRDTTIVGDTISVAIDTIPMGFYPGTRYDIPDGGKTIFFSLPYSLYSGTGDNSENLQTLLDWLGTPSGAP